MNQFTDSKPPMLNDGAQPATETKGITKSVPNYVVIRSGGKPEPLIADDDVQMKEIVQRQVRTGQVPIMYVYKLHCAEAFVPSSETHEGSPEEIKEKASATN